MNGFYGWAGKILYVNLKTSHAHTEPTSRFARKFLGGRGINWAMLYDKVKPRTDSLSPENVLGIGVGVLVGTIAPSACRFSVDAKNPFTGGIGSGNGGGHWAPELKYSGYDNIFIFGKAEKPIYLWIDNGRVECRDAKNLWGRTTWQTSELIREELADPDIQVLSIGPAGENLCLAAALIANNGRAVGRCGLGAVWGSKNLKAIAVRGEGLIEVAHPDKFIDLIDLFLQVIKENKEVQLLSKLGTTARVKDYESVRNAQGIYFKDFSLKAGGQALAGYSIRKLSGFSCPIQCSRWLEVKEGPLKGTKGEGIEANTSDDWGKRIGVGYLPAIIKLHILCNQLGLDIDVPSVTIAWAMECYQRGILTKEDTDGLDLKWGNYEAVIELVKGIAYRKGKFANLLADGVIHASRRIGRGSDRFAMHVKKQDLYEDGRMRIGWALGVATSTRGGTHTRGSPGTEGLELPSTVAEEAYGISMAFDPKAYKGKGKLVVYMERLKGIIDALGICMFISKWLSPSLLGQNEFAELLHATTGWKVTGKDLLRIGERMQTVEKAFNVREAGFTRKDDTLPKRMFEPIPSGPYKGLCIDKEKWEKALDEYYKEHKWDVQTGLPTKKRLIELGLRDIADDLGKMVSTRGESGLLRP